MKTADRLLVLLAFVLEPPSLPGEREEPTSRIILIVRVGRLAPQEISPRSRSDAPTIWDLACEGVTFTQVELPDGGPGPALAALDISLLPEQARVGSKSPAALLDVSGEPVAEVSSSRAAANPGSAALEALKARFGQPPLPGEDEVAQVQALRKALGASPQALPGLSSAPEKAQSLKDESIRWARAAVLRMRAETDSEGAVRYRDGLLARILGLLGEGACVAVLNWPVDGPGTLVISRLRAESQKPFPAGRVQSAKKRLAEVSLVLKDFLEKKAPDAPSARPEMPKGEVDEPPK